MQGILHFHNLKVLQALLVTVCQEFHQATVIIKFMNVCCYWTRVKT